MSARTETSVVSSSFPGDWRTAALRSLVALWRRRGSVALEDVEAVIPEDAAHVDLQALVSDLRAAGVSVTLGDDEKYGPAGASVINLYFRDIGRKPLLGSDGEWRLARVFRNGVRRRARALSRTVAGARVAVAAVRAAVAGDRPVHAVVSDEVGKQGRTALSMAVERAQAAIDACVGADAAVVDGAMFWSRHDVPSGLVCGRARVRMSRAVQALGLCPPIFDEMVEAVGKELSRVARVVRDGDAAARGCPRVVSRRVPAGPDPAALIQAALDRAASGQRDSGDARERFITTNLRVVVKFARRMWRPECGVSLPDLIQEGNVGLMKAVERFEPSQGRFTTYAAWWIRQSMRKAITETGRTVRIPVHVQDRLADVSVVESEFLRQRGSRPGAAEVADWMGVDTDTVERLRLVPRHSVSTDAPVSVGDEESQTWVSRLADPDALDPEAVVRGQEFRRALVALMESELEAVEQAALCRRFGLNDLVGVAGERLLKWIPRERLRRLEMRALRKIQGAAGVESLRAFLGADGGFAPARG